MNRICKVMMSVLAVMMITSTTVSAWETTISETMNDATKNWLAINAGIKGCYVPNGISYVTPDGPMENRRTGEILIVYWVLHALNMDTFVPIAGTNYNDLKAINDGVDITLDGDIRWALNHDGGFNRDGSTEIYCIPDVNGDTNGDTNGDATNIPEFPTVALPIASIIGMFLIFQYKRKK